MGPTGDGGFVVLSQGLIFYELIEHDGRQPARSPHRNYCHLSLSGEEQRHRRVGHVLMIDYTRLGSRNRDDPAGHRQSPACRLALGRADPIITLVVKRLSSLPSKQGAGVRLPSSVFFLPQKTININHGYD